MWLLMIDIIKGEMFGEEGDSTTSMIPKFYDMSSCDTVDIVGVLFLQDFVNYF